MKSLSFILPFLLFITSFSLKAQQSDTLLIYPNPFADTTTFEIQNLNNDLVSLVVVNKFGALVKTFYKDTVLSGNKINLFIGDTLPDDIYFVIYKINLTTKSRKILKNSSVNITENWSRKNQIKIFPNPAQDVLNIDANQEITSVEIFDVSGKIIQAYKVAHSNSETIDIRSLSAGEYIVVVTQGFQKISKPFIKD
jgi:hypothetical protein